MYNLPYGCIDYMHQKGARQLSRVCATQAEYMYDYVVVGISHNLHWVQMTGSAHAGLRDVYFSYAGLGVVCLIACIV